MYLNVILRSFEVDMSEWIKIADEVPCSYTDILMVDNLGLRHYGTLEIEDGLHYINQSYSGEEVVYWMPLPELPK